MCGICGVLTVDPSAGNPSMGEPVERVRAMLALLAHRGPDDAALETVAAGALGASRLAIRGLDSGRQPLVDRSAGVTAVCNGEIDNHRELRAWLAARGRTVRGATDVAVIPGLYLELGPAFVEKLVGSFALAVWDGSRQRVLLARDRAGEKPLYFTRRGPTVLFASELAALAVAGAPREVDRRAIAHYLQFGTFPAPRTPFVGVEKVRPAEWVEIDAAGSRRHRYWRWRSPSARDRTVGEEELDRAFRQAITRQSDVETPLGVFLSGGLDSSLVAAVLRAVRPHEPIASFTVRFRETSFDEGSWAERVAASLGLAPAVVWMESADVPRTLPRLVRASGEPLGDPAWVPAALLSQRAAEQAKVVLVGEGGDELFGGYPTYFGLGLAQRYERLPAFLRRRLARLARGLPPSEKKVTISYLLRRFVEGEGLPPLARHAVWNANLSPALFPGLGVEPPPLPETDEDWSDPLALVQSFDLETSLAEGLLTKADRASMQAGLELRAPFLDVAVMELAAHLPRKARVSGLETKPLLKRYALRYVRREIVYRRKRGLSVPMAKWLRGELAGWAEERLGGSALAALGIDPKGALDLLAAHRARRADHARGLFGLLALAEWSDWVASLPGN